jgi:hypothetical protein
MSIDRREHQAWLHRCIWQDRRHVAHHAWLALRQRIRARTVNLGRLPRLWRQPPLGYLVAVLAQLTAVSLTLQLRLVLLQAFTYRGALSFLVIVVVALRWGVGPSLLATLLGGALLKYRILPPTVAGA